MSHFTRMTTRIRDGELLVQCLQAMGYEPRPATAVHGFAGNAAAVELVVPMPQGYQIGLVRGNAGFYEIVADWWGVQGTKQEQFMRQLEAEFATVQQRLRREYALRTTLTQLQKQGFAVVEQATAPDGSVKILARRWR